MNSSKSSPLISVFTVNWNGLKWLEKYLTCLSKQTYKNLEIIVVDNDSTDNSVEYIQKKFPKVKIVKNKKNYGLAKATNIAVENSKGDFVFFINNDTWFENNFIEKLYNFYGKNDYTVVSAKEERYFDNKYFNCNTTIDLFGAPAYFHPTLRKEKLFYLTVCFLCKKEDYISSKGNDSDFFMYYEDVDWFWRLSLLGKKFMMDQNTVIHHAGAGSSGTGLRYNFFLWRNQNALQALLKNYSLPMLIFVIPIYVLINLIEILFFLVFLKPKISYSYIEGWIFNIKNFKSTLKKRKWIQANRVVGDLEIIKKMYFGSGKYLLLLDFMKINFKKNHK